jgi:hypothetical protein
MNCTYCNKTFSSKCVLVKHQKTAKYCMLLQSSEKKEENCSEECNYKTSRSDNLRTHRKNCITYITTTMQAEINILNSQLREKDETAIKLKEEVLLLKKELEIVYKFQERSTSCVEEIAKQPKTNSSSRIKIENYGLTAPLIWPDEKEIQQIVEEKYTSELLHKGQAGVAEFVYVNFLSKSGEKVCAVADNSRRIFCFLTKDGNLEKDPDALKLLQPVYEPIVSKASSIGKSAVQAENVKLQQKLDEFMEGPEINEDDEEDETKSFSWHTKKLFEIDSLYLDMKNDIKDVNNSSKNSIFCKTLMSKI